MFPSFWISFEPLFIPINKKSLIGVSGHDAKFLYREATLMKTKRICIGFVWIGPTLLTTVNVWSQ